MTAKSPTVTICGGCGAPDDRNKPHNCAPTLTVRDHFALAGLIGLLDGEASLSINPRIYAKYAYQIADLMLEERQAEKP